jgi:hypothetical protein
MVVIVSERLSHYRLADEPGPVIEVACSKCEWKAGFSRAELLAMYGAESPLPTLETRWRIGLTGACEHYPNGPFEAGPVIRPHAR